MGLVVSGGEVLNPPDVGDGAWRILLRRMPPVVTLACGAVTGFEIVCVVLRPKFSGKVKACNGRASGQAQ